MEELDAGHFHAIGNYSQFNGTNGTIANLSLLNFDVDDENPYGLRYSMATTVVLRYASHPQYATHIHLASIPKYFTVAACNLISSITFVYCPIK